MTKPNPQLAYGPAKPFTEMSDSELEHELLDHLTWARLYLQELSDRQSELWAYHSCEDALRSIKHIIAKFKEE